jgi:glycosyltransferase involved in cell wall biosynthesis
VRPRIGHYQHALPLRPVGASVVTVHDLSFEREPASMPRSDRLMFRTAVPRSARRADRVIAVSHRTRADLVGVYGIPREKIRVILHGVDPAFAPGDGTHHGYLLFVGSVELRKDPLAALDAAADVGMPLVMAGPVRSPALAADLSVHGADLRGYVDKRELAELYRGAACLVAPSLYEGFGLPVLEALASGTPVVATPDPAVMEVAGDVAVYADRHNLAGAILHAIERREELRAAGLARAAQFSWAETARRTVDVYRELL